MKSFDFFSGDRDYYNYLAAITGQDYLFASAAVRKWNNKIDHGEFFQLMPLQVDDGFFDWYILESPNQQFFVNKTEAVLRFIKYWIEWKQMK